LSLASPPPPLPPHPFPTRRSSDLSQHPSRGPRPIRRRSRTRCRSPEDPHQDRAAEQYKQHEQGDLHSGAAERLSQILRILLEQRSSPQPQHVHLSSDTSSCR